MSELKLNLCFIVIALQLCHSGSYTGTESINWPFVRIGETSPRHTMFPLRQTGMFWRQKLQPNPSFNYNYFLKMKNVFEPATQSPRFKRYHLRILATQAGDRRKLPNVYYAANPNFRIMRNTDLMRILPQTFTHHISPKYKSSPIIGDDVDEHKSFNSSQHANQFDVMKSNQIPFAMNPPTSTTSTPYASNDLEECGDQLTSSKLGTAKTSLNYFTFSGPTELVSSDNLHRTTTRATPQYLPTPYSYAKVHSYFTIDDAIIPQRYNGYAEHLNTLRDEIKETERTQKYDFATPFPTEHTKDLKKEKHPYDFLLATKETSSTTEKSKFTQSYFEYRNASPSPTSIWHETSSISVKIADSSSNQSVKVVTQNDSKISADKKGLPEIYSTPILIDKQVQTSPSIETTHQTEYSKLSTSTAKPKSFSRNFKAYITNKTANNKRVASTRKSPLREWKPKNELKPTTKEDFKPNHAMEPTKRTKLLGHFRRSKFLAKNKTTVTTLRSPVAEVTTPKVWRSVRSSKNPLKIKSESVITSEPKTLKLSTERVYIRKNPTTTTVSQSTDIVEAKTTYSTSTAESAIMRIKGTHQKNANLSAPTISVTNILKNAKQSQLLKMDFTNSQLSKSTGNPVLPIEVYFRKVKSHRNNRHS